MNRFEWPRVWEAVVAGVLLAAILGIRGVLLGEFSGLGPITILRWIGLVIVSPVGVPYWLVVLFGLSGLYFARPALRILQARKISADPVVASGPVIPAPIIVPHDNEPPSPPAPPQLSEDELKLMGVFSALDEDSFQTPEMAQHLGMSQLRFDEAVYSLQQRGFARHIRGGYSALPALVLTDEGRRFVLSRLRT